MRTPRAIDQLGRMRSFFALLVIGTSSAGLLAACGGDSSNVDGGADATTSDAPSNDGASDVATNDTGTNDSGSDTGATDGGCSPGTGCRACCAAEYPDAEAFFANLEEKCACTTPGDCSSACSATLCTGAAPDPACLKCLRDPDAGDCEKKGLGGCVASPACHPLAVCVQACGAADAAAD